MWWKIYFWIILILTVISLLVLPQYFPLGPYDIISVLISVILLLGTYTFVCRKKILQKYWKPIYWILVFFFIEELLEIYIFPKDLVTNLLQSNIPLNPTERVLSLLLSLPALYAIYKLSALSTTKS